MALPKNRGVSEGKRKAGKAVKPGAGRPSDPKYDRYRWYAEEASFSKTAWWSNVKNRESVAPDLAPALFWERVRRHPDFPELRAAWLKLNQTAKVDPTILDDFWGENGGDNVRDALGLICGSWKLDYGALLKADADAGLDPRNRLRPWPRGFAALGAMLSESGAFSPSKGQVCTDLLQWVGEKQPSTGGWAVQPVFGLPTSTFACPIWTDGSPRSFERNQIDPSVSIGWDALKAGAHDLGRVPLLLAIDPDGSIDALVEQFREIVLGYLKGPTLKRKSREDGFAVIKLLDGLWKGESKSDIAAICGRFEKSARLDLSKLTVKLRVAAEK
jgi:hypothetical protein